MLENTESQEMYLATIYALQKKNGMVRSVDVADERGYSKASVHNAMKRLEEFGYVTFHQGKITLTKCGLEKVKNVEQKHQTIASALKLIGASNDIAEENACRIKIKKQNSKFAVGEDEFFPTFQINTKIEVCIPNPQIWVQAILGEYGDIFYGYFLFAQYRYF